MLNLLSLYFRAELMKALRYPAALVLNIVSMVLIVFVQYKVLSAYNSSLTSRELVVYLLVAAVLFSASTFSKLPNFCEALKKGEVIKYLCLPFYPSRVFAVKDFCTALIQLLFYVPLFSLVLVSYGALRTLIFVISACVGLFIAVLVAHVFYCLSFVLKNFSASKALLAAISSFFAGSLIPLALLPQFFVDLAYKTPFAMVVDAPLQVLMQGNYRLLLVQLAWALVLYALASILISQSIKKIEIFGG